MLLATATRILKKAWARLRSVPAWLWAVVGWFVAFLALRSVKKKHDRLVAMSKAEKSRQRSLSKRTRSIAKIKRRLASDLRDAEERHQAKRDQLRKKDESLVKTAGDAEAITDAVNDSFGGDE